jgi:hypothetical protein
MTLSKEMNKYDACLRYIEVVLRLVIENGNRGKKSSDLSIDAFKE